MSNGNASAAGQDLTQQSDTWGSHVKRLATFDLQAVLGEVESPPLSNDFEAPGPHNSIIHRIEAQIKRGSPITFSTFAAFWDLLRNQNGVGLDDRKFLLENILVLMSRLPPKSLLATQVEHLMVDILYKDLPHPPATFLAPYVPAQATANVPGSVGFAWREADGRNNNPLMPDLGAAHMPYARSVAASHISPPAALPDPGLIFDTLLKRPKDKDVPHPTGLSSMFFAFANLIIHSLFRTNLADSRINDTSSYLDLSPLYGVDMDEQATVRRFDGTGRLYDDVFADHRLLAMPPETAALCIIFCRNHNFIATRILEINESGTYTPNPSDDLRRRQDDEIFNRARLVNCGTFMQVIMRDYVGSILHMTQDLSPWHLRPLEPIRNLNHEITPRGEGNMCSVEFNLLYRWHATTSTKNEKWLDVMFKRLLPEQPYDKITKEAFYGAVRGIISRASNDPRQWGLGTIGRDENGRFSDADLATVLQSATEDSAQAFRARGIPAAFRIIEIMGIEQARTWGVCSLNEFRSFLGLKPYGSFAEWNSDPEIAAAASHLYHDINNMELYVGMQAEEARPAIPGSGLCSGYTMSRSILADAIALIRGDRFLTTEYTPYNLTSWGFQDTQTTNDNGSLGGMLTKLLFRALPQHYTPNSAYAHFPFILPKAMENFMLKKDPAMAKKYIWTPPRELSPLTRIIAVNTPADVRTVLERRNLFLGNYEAQSRTLTDRLSFYYGGANTHMNERHERTIREILFTSEANARHGEYYYDKASELICTKSYPQVGIPTRTVDIVREVVNYIPLHWIKAEVANISLTTPEHVGKFSEEELYGYFAVIFSYIFFNWEPVNSWFLQEHSHKAAKTILGDLSTKFSRQSWFGTVRRMLLRDAQQERSDVLHQLMNQINDNTDAEHREEVLTQVFGIMVNSVANWAQAMTHVIDFYLKPVEGTQDDPQKSAAREEIVRLAGRRPFTQNEESLLIGYVREALRLNPPVGGVLREAQASGILPPIEVNRGDRLFVNLHSQLRDTLRDYNAIDPQRRRSEQPPFTPGAHSSLNEDFSNKTMAQVLRAVFSKKNLRRGPGVSGRLVRFTENIHGAEQTLYIDSNGQSTIWPQSLIVQYDE